jgi:hypothetical protein
MTAGVVYVTNLTPGSDNPTPRRSPEASTSSLSQTGASWSGTLLPTSAPGRVGTFHVILQSKHVRLMTAGMVHVRLTNLTPESDNPSTGQASVSARNEKTEIVQDLPAGLLPIVLRVVCLDDSPVGLALFTLFC